MWTLDKLEEKEVEQKEEKYDGSKLSEALAEINGYEESVE